MPRLALNDLPAAPSGRASSRRSAPPTSRPDTSRPDVLAPELTEDARWVTAISGTVSQWAEAVTFHFDQGPDALYCPAGHAPGLSSVHEMRFPLHREEYVAAVAYKHRRAAMNNRVLGCGIEFETSFGRTFLLCGRPDSCFSWASGGDKAVWRAGPGRCIVGLYLGKVERRGRRGA